MAGYRILPICAADPEAVEALLDAAFGPDRHDRTAYRLRDGVEAVAALSFAALDGDGRLLGSIQCWPLCVNGADGRIPAVLVGPVAVAPERQQGGIGKALVHASLAAAAAAHASPGADLQVMIGDPDYYGRFFGFSAAPTAGWSVPGPVERHRLLVRNPAGRALPHVALLEPRSGS